MATVTGHFFKRLDNAAASAYNRLNSPVPAKGPTSPRQYPLIRLRPLGTRSRDCGIGIESLPVSDSTKDAVRRLTHVKGEPLGPYYREVGESRVASIVKLLDRCDNVSTMAGVFSVEKINQYIEETREYVLPLLRRAKDQWPSDSNALFVLKYHIVSVIDGLEVCLRIKGGGDANA